jgi:hypothetical protein
MGEKWPRNFAESGGFRVTRKSLMFDKISLRCMLKFFFEMRMEFERHVKVKVQQSRNRHGVAQRVPGDLGSQIS